MNIKYIELKHDGVRGEGRIGRVTFSKSGKAIYYKDRVLAPISGWSLKANYYDESTLEEFWVSNPTKNGSDSLYPTVVEVDEDAREEYWISIRNDNANINRKNYKSPGKARKLREKSEKAVRRRDMDRRFRAP